MKYKTLIKRTEAQLTEQEQKFQVEDNEAQLKEDLRVTKRAITQEERQLLSLKSKATLSSSDILASMQRVDDLKAGAEALSKLIDELF